MAVYNRLIFAMSKKRTYKLSLSPYPADLILNLDQRIFTTEEWKDAIGLASKVGSTLQMQINLKSSKEIQLEAIVHESVHIV